MNNLRARIEKLSPKRLALLALELQDRVDELEQQLAEPIAIIGMGCRVPGPDPGLEGFWRLLEEGRDVVSEIPPERWDAAAYYDPDPDAPGRMATKSGGFLKDISGFDAPFFGISRREANSMDPQQRMLLEVCWEALEDAGYCPRKAAGGSVGVFTGITTTDYHSLMVERGEENITVHMATGSGNNIASGRISYVLALQGPNLSVDTGCSSSLVALHLACQSLRSGECRMALATGVNALLAPELFIALSKVRALAPDGRCKAFDARADGFARAEGCGVVVLKRLSHALADRDHILAVIRGTAVNQDGRSSGMTAPNGAAQEALLREALDKSGLAAGDVDYVETHGTGTPLGDPIEAHSIASALGANRDPEHPLFIGSVKTNVGHLEAAAGVIGLIKIVLALKHETIPQHLHFESLNPHIDWKGMPLQVAARPIPWPPSERQRIAGLNSFGLSGTNVHVVVEEAPALTIHNQAVDRPLHLLALSARTKTALAALQSRFAEHLTQSIAALADICYTASVGRAHFEHRAAFLATDCDSMRVALTAAPVAAGHATETTPVVFLFPGQGAQFSGMARQLYQTQPVFRDVLDECARLLEGHIQAPLLEVLWESPQWIDQTVYTQPALFAVEYALARLWMSWGVEPAAVAGHSVGEYVAACVAGVFSLEDGLKLIAERARLMQSVAGEGAMAAVMADQEQVRKALAGFEDRVAIAALNAPGNTVISGYRPELDRVQEALEKQGIRVQRLSVSHAFHSPQMREMEAAFEQVAATIHCQSPRLRIISSVTGMEISDELCDPAYWRRQVAQAVRFQDVVRTLERSGYRTFLEVGPGTTLAALGQQCIADADSNTTWLASMRRSRDDWRQMLDSLAHLYTLGVSIDWTGFDKPYVRSRLPLPTYPFERERYWFEDQNRSQRVPGGKTRRDESVDGWFYRTVWEEKDAQLLPPDTAGRWLIVPDRQGIAEALASKLQAAGARVAFAATPEALASQLGDGFDFVFHAASLDFSAPAEMDEPSLAGAHSALERTIATAHALISEPNGARLWIATRGAQPVLSNGEDSNASLTSLWGLGRTFALEHPDAWGGLVDLDPKATNSEIAAALFSAIGRDNEDQIAFRNGRRYVARLVQHKETASPVRSLAADKTYLITGGAGGLGLQLCSWMAAHGARHLTILGRRAPSSEAESILAGLRERGVAVEFRAADVTSTAQLQIVFAEFGTYMPPLGGVVHAAGVLDDSIFANLTAERVAKVLAPKVQGAWNLHQLTAGLSLDFFVLFSSLASVTGSPGQAAYSAANAFLDGLAHHRAASGLPALSLNWGGWSGAGMAGRVDASVRPNSGPFRQMRAELALAALGRLLSSAAVQIAVADVDWDEFESSTGRQNIRPFFTSMLRAAAAPKTSVDGLSELSSLTPDALRAKLISQLQSALAQILGIEDTAVAATRSLVDLGLDSLMALEFRNRIRADFHVTIPTAKLLIGPTLESLADEIAPQVSGPAQVKGEAKPALTAMEYPLSLAQQAQWFGHKLTPGSSTFNVGFTVSVSPPLDWDAFERALTRLAERHAALRTTIFEIEPGHPVQRVSASTNLDLQRIDASGWTDEQLKARALEEFNEAFSLEHSMVRIRVLRAEHATDILVVAFDHLIVDASSLLTCFEDLREIYGAEVTRTEPKLKPLGADYSDFVTWEAKRAEGPEADRLWKFWSEKLGGHLPILNLPSSRPHPEVLLPKGESVVVSFGPLLSAAVYRIARDKRATTYSVLLAAYFILLKMYCGQDDILVGTSVSQRDDERWSGVLGYFINVLPLRVDLSGDPLFPNHLANVRETVLDGLAHHDYPFPVLVSRLGGRRDMKHSPIFQAFLNFLQDRAGEYGGLVTPGGNSAIRFGDSTMRPFVFIPQEDGRSEIALHIGQNEDQLAGNLNYNGDILDRATAQAMAASYLEILENIVADPDRPISEFISHVGQPGEEEELLL